MASLKYLERQLDEPLCCRKVGQDEGEDDDLEELQLLSF
jgi:hypothetical protein